MLVKRCRHSSVICSILGRIIRVTQEVDEYREWIRKNWGNAAQNDVTLNSRRSVSLVCRLFISEKKRSFYVTPAPSLSLLARRKRRVSVWVPAARWMQQQRGGGGRWRRRGGFAIGPQQQNVVQLVLAVAVSALLALPLPAVAVFNIVHLQFQWRSQCSQTPLCFDHVGRRLCSHPVIVLSSAGLWRHPVQDGQAAGRSELQWPPGGVDRRLESEATEPRQQLSVGGEKRRKGTVDSISLSSSAIIKSFYWKNKKFKTYSTHFPH